MPDERNLAVEIEEVEQAVATVRERVDNLTLFAVRLEAKLDRVDAKLDRILAILETPPATSLRLEIGTAVPQ